ncbi:MAG TPA: SAM-dependent methyltransferase [Telluria sp.]|nr:SAM-dependent methyltransferase [Telluria sp.]
MRENKPSNTALIVAAGLQLASEQRTLTHLMPLDAIRRGAAVLRAAHPRMAAMLPKPWFRRVALFFERATLPGISLHFALRKRLLRRHAQAAIAAGCRQIVVLGAGFDTLCAELLAADPALRCIEIDHPATQRIKRAAVGEGGHGVHFIGVDLAAQPLAGVLAGCAVFDSTIPTLFVAEGLLMYVPPDAVATLFRQMRVAAPACRVAFTWLEPQADGKPNFRRRSMLIDWWLAVRGEPFMSGMLRGDLPAFLAQNGFELDAVDESDALLGPAERRAVGERDMPLAGEYICFAHTTLPSRSGG